MAKFRVVGFPRQHTNRNRLFIEAIIDTGGQFVGYEVDSERDIENKVPQPNEPNPESHRG